MKLLKTLTFLFILGIASLTFASSSNISTTSHYAYAENVGFIDFAQANVTSTALEGYAFGENIGWINLSGVTNNKGTLSGYAWGENVGFIDFSKVTIDNGIFTGNAYGENIGWITFSPTDPNSKVVTTWKLPSSHSSSGSVPTKTISQVITPTTPPTIETPKITKTLKLGLKNDSEVKTLQSYLNLKLKLTLTLDGSFGPKTKLAVISFQKLNKLTPDGIVGPITRALLIK